MSERSLLAYTKPEISPVGAAKQLRLASKRGNMRCWTAEGCVSPFRWHPKLSQLALH